jgi:hypothetical protein
MQFNAVDAAKLESPQGFIFLNTISLFIENLLI